MSINLTITCCSPGYKLNGTCKPDREQYEIIVRADVSNTYLYINVRKALD